MGRNKKRSEIEVMAEIFVDSEEISSELIGKLYKLAKDVYDQIPEKRNIIGKKLLEAIDSLLPEEAYVLKGKYGIIDNFNQDTIVIVTRTEEKTEKIDIRTGIPESVIEEIAKEALAKLKRLSGKYDAKLIKRRIKGEEEFSKLELSDRTFSVLRHAGVLTIYDFAKLTLEDCEKIRRLGEKGIEEIRKAREKMKWTPLWESPQELKNCFRTHMYSSDTTRDDDISYLKISSKIVRIFKENGIGTIIDFLLLDNEKMSELLKAKKIEEDKIEDLQKIKEILQNSGIQYIPRIEEEKNDKDLDQETLMFRAVLERKFSFLLY